MAPERRSHQYIAHAGGASKVMFVRCPRRVRTNFEYNLFRTQRGRIVSIIVSHTLVDIGADMILFSFLRRYSEGNIAYCLWANGTTSARRNAEALDSQVLTTFSRASAKSSLS